MKQNMEELQAQNEELSKAVITKPKKKKKSTANK